MKNPIIAIIDYGVGNTYSVSNAIKTLGYTKTFITDNLDSIRSADVLVLPGVGAFQSCITNLINRQLIETLNEQVLIKKKPILGICVGMQLLSTFSEENGKHMGLNWIPGKVKKIILPKDFAVPHVGWNDVTFKIGSPLFVNLKQSSNFYFDHSYEYDCDEKFVTAHANYGKKIIAAIQNENIFGVQFHPEKSQICGLKLFRSFFNSINKC